MGNSNLARGFTLLELIVGLTITSLILLVLYSAFSTGARVWERQGEGTEDVIREETMVRLLHSDFTGMRPFNMLWERGRLFFFAGSSKAIYYVTSNGLGANHRDGNRLFFTCLFLAENENGGMGLFLYKSGVPEPGLIRAVHDHHNLGEGMRAMYSPPEWLRENAVRIVGEMESARFSFAADEFIPFGGSIGESTTPSGLMIGEQDFAKEFWNEPGLPGQVQLSYTGKTRDNVRILLIPQWGRP